MSRSRVPIAMCMPISRVRVTDTRMIFMMPIPPTSSDAEAIAPNSSDMLRVVCAALLAATHSQVVVFISP